MKRRILTVLLTAIFFAFGNSSYGNNCSTAIPLNHGNTPSEAVVSNHKDVTWFSFVASSAIMEFVAYDYGFDANVNLYTNSCNDLKLLKSNNSGQIAYHTLSPGVQYFVEYKGTCITNDLKVVLADTVIIDTLDLDCQGLTDCNKIANGDFEQNTVQSSGSGAFSSGRVAHWSRLLGTPDLIGASTVPAAQIWSMAYGSHVYGESVVTCTDLQANKLYILSVDHKRRDYRPGQVLDVYMNIGHSTDIDNMQNSSVASLIPNFSGVSQTIGYTEISTSGVWTRTRTVFEAQADADRFFVFGRTTATDSALFLALDSISIIPIEYPAHTTCERIQLIPNCLSELGSFLNDFSFQWSVVSGPGIIASGANTLTPQISIMGASTTFKLTLTDMTTMDQYGVIVPVTYTSLVDNPVITPTCIGSSTGSIVPNISGGTPPYTYAWSTGANTSSISNLSQGAYGLEVYDANGCRFKEGYTVNASNVFASITCTSGLRDQVILLATASGGTAPYTYKWTWSDPVQMQSLVSYNNPVTINHYSQLMGVITLIVTDANGCTYTTTIDPNRYICGGSVFSDGRTSRLASTGLAGDIKVYPNPTKETLHIDLQGYAESIESVQVFNELSQILIEVEQPEGGIDVSTLQSGIYFMQIRTENGFVMKQFVKE